MNRRTYLAVVGASSVTALTALSGCSSGGESGSSGGAQEATQTATATPTEVEETTADATAGTGTVIDGGGSSGTTVGMYTEGESYYFDPVGLFVEPGATVEWTLESGSHSATSYSSGNTGAETTRIPQGASGFDSGTISSGSFTHTFETAGTYDYYCIPHKTLGMVARIVVGEPGGPATQGQIPDQPGEGSVPSSEVIVQQGSVGYPYTNG